MIGFIKAKGISGDDAFINYDHVVLIERMDRGGSRIVPTGGGFWFSDSSPEEIFADMGRGMAKR